MALQASLTIQHPPQTTPQGTVGYARTGKLIVARSVIRMTVR